MQNHFGEIFFKIPGIIDLMSTFPEKEGWRGARLPPNGCPALPGESARSLDEELRVSWPPPPAAPVGDMTKTSDARMEDLLAEGDGTDPAPGLPEKEGGRGFGLPAAGGGPSGEKGELSCDREFEDCCTWGGICMGMK